MVQWLINYSNKNNIILKNEYNKINMEIIHFYLHTLITLFK